MKTMMSEVKMHWIELMAEKTEKEKEEREGWGRGRRKEEERNFCELQDNFNQPNIHINAACLGEKRMRGPKYLISWLKVSLVFCKPVTPKIQGIQ